MTAGGEKHNRLSHPWKGPPKEKRRWHRYPAAEGAQALLEGRPYRILDISRGGLAIFSYGEGAVPDEMLLSLHMVEEGHFLESLLCRKVSDKRVVSQSTYSTELIQRVSLEIMDEDPDLEARLTPFIRRT
jgi:hypothetical protein